LDIKQSLTVWDVGCTKPEALCITNLADGVKVYLQLEWSGCSL